MTRRLELVTILATWALLVSVPIVSADSMPYLVWGSSIPWATRPYGSTNQIGGGRLDEVSVVAGEFWLEGTDQPAVISWTYWAYGIFWAGGGYTPWEQARLELVGQGTISWLGLDIPSNWTDPLVLWTLNETSCPLSGPETWGNFSVEPRQVLSTIQPGFMYQVIQFNWSGLNYFDLGYSQATLESTIELVPEPATMLLLGSGLIGLSGYGRKKFFKK
jgi:PEP-CTERM motif